MCGSATLRKNGLKSWWQRTKAWLYPAVKKRKRAAAEKADKGSSASLSADELTEGTMDSSSEIHVDDRGDHALTSTIDLVITCLHLFRGPCSIFRDPPEQ